MSTLKLENISPLIQYYGPGGSSGTSAWVPGSPASDPEWDRYSDGTFSVTQTVGASAIINFNGTHVTIYGAKRGNHNLYNVSLDHAPAVSNSGASGTDQFQVALFDSGDLANGPHTVTITDASTNADPNQSYLDVDFITIVSSVGKQQIVVEDNESPFIYTPDTSAWNTSPQNVTEFSSQNGHSTNVNGGRATIAFVGDSIDVFGLVGGSAGAYTVSIDGATAVGYTAANTVLRTQQILYSGRNLGDMQHTITITNVGVSGSTLNIDYAQVYGRAPQALSADGAAGQNLDSTTQASSSSTTASTIIGVLAALLIIAIGAIIFMLILMRRRSRQHRRHSGFTVDSNSAPQPAVQLEPYMQQAAPSLTIPSAYSHSIPRPGQGYYTSSVQEESMYPASNEPASPVRGEAPPLPPKASLAQRRTNLPYIASRAEDFGPVEMLPPDYGQATRR